MLLVAFINVFGNAYVAAFGETNELWFVVCDQFMESLFLLDMVFNFLEEYSDEETYTYVSDLKKISLRYLQGKFIFDLLAWLPFNLMIELFDGRKRLFRVLKMLRLPRLAQLLNVERVKKLVNEHY